MIGKRTRETFISTKRLNERGRNIETIEARSLGKILIRPSKRNRFRILFTENINKAKIGLKGRQGALVRAKVRFNIQAVEIRINTIEVAA